MNFGPPPARTKSYGERSPKLENLGKIMAKLELLALNEGGQNFGATICTGSHFYPKHKNKHNFYPIFMASPRYFIFQKNEKFEKIKKN